MYPVVFRAGAEVRGQAKEKMYFFGWRTVFFSCLPAVILEGLPAVFLEGQAL